MKLDGIGVMVLDDEEVVRDTLVDFLEDFEMTVYSFSSGKEALKKLPELPVDIAIVDLRMLDMTGVEFIFKAHELRPTLRYLIYTGSTDFVISRDLLEIGLEREDVYFKPMRDMMDFLDAIQRILDRG